MDFNYEINFLKKLYRFNNGICFFTVLVLLFPAIQAEAVQYEILAFGDSITQGVKVDSDGVKSGILSPPGGIRTIDGYEPELELLAESTPDTVYVYNWGYGGERTNAGLNRIDSVLASRSAQYILVMEGANDILAGISTATTTFNLEQMVLKSRETFIEPILATVTPNTKSGATGKNDIIANDLNVKIKKLALKYGIGLADQYKNLSPPPDGTGWVTIYNSGDGLHLSDEGERRVAQTWFNSLLQSPQFQQDSGVQGIVSIEAEHFHASTPYSKNNWTLKALAGSSGNEAMQATPNIGISITANYAPLKSPRLDFDVNFVKTGTHYIWVRGYGPGTGADSIHIGLDNAAIPAAGNMKSFSPTKSWVWCGDAEGTGILARATINIPSTGLHTINAWMREDGFIFDKIVITKDAQYVPTGLGPGESPNLDSGSLEQYSPQIISTAPDSVIVNNVYQYDVNAAGLPEPNFALANGPVGMVINPATGQLSWTPDTVGTYSVTVIAQNSIGSDSQSFTITVVLGQSTLPSGLVSYWTLDETGGLIFQDETGQNIGQCTTNCPKAIVGLVDGGQHFNGTKRINVASDNSLDWSLGESFSLEFWMRKSTITIENEPVIDRYDKSSNAHWWAGVGHNVSPGKARFFVRDRAGTTFAVSGTKPLTDGLWHHVVAVQDALNSELRIYVDGVLEGTASTSYSSDFVMPSTPVTIGQVTLPSSSVTMDFIGDLDEVTVYSRVMSFNEIGAHFESGYLGLGYFEIP